MKYLVLLGRILFSAIFVFSGFTHFSASTIAYAADQGVWFASFLVPFSGILAIIGGASIILGFLPRMGACLLILFLVPVTFTMHPFWSVSNPSEAMIQQIMFFKNISMLGGAILIAYFGSGPLSLTADARLRDS